MPNKSLKFNALIFSIQTGLLLNKIDSTLAIEALGYLMDASMSSNPGIIASIETYEATQSVMAIQYVNAVKNGEDYKQISWAKAAQV